MWVWRVCERHLRVRSRLLDLFGKILYEGILIDYLLFEDNMRVSFENVDYV